MRLCSMLSLRLSFSLLLPSPGLSMELLFWVPSQPALLPSWDWWEACWELGRQQELCSAPGHPPATPKLSTTRGWDGVGAGPTLPSVPDPAVPAAPEAEDLPGAWQGGSPSSVRGVALGTGRAVGWQGQGAGGWMGCCSRRRGSVSWQELGTGPAQLLMQMWPWLWGRSKGQCGTGTLQRLLCSQAAFAWICCEGSRMQGRHVQPSAKKAAALADGGGQECPKGLGGDCKH